MPLSDRIKSFLANPPAGSRTREALDFGVDLSLTSQRLGMTIEERLADIGQKMDWLKSLRGARRNE
jgi:hypothetical protein